MSHPRHFRHITADVAMMMMMMMMIMLLTRHTHLDPRIFKFSMPQWEVSRAHDFHLISSSTRVWLRLGENAKF
jgi:hypothetical protein